MATKTKKTPKDKYKPNQFVVHPHHGAAKVIRKVNKNVEIQAYTNGGTSIVSNTWDYAIENWNYYDL